MPFGTTPALLMYPEGFLNAPSTLHVLAPQPWKVATGLPPVPGQKNTFRAENFDILYDSPVEVSNFKTLSFEVKGVPHRIVIDGEGNYDPEKMRADVKKIVETEVELMGGEIPYHDYTFILHLRANTGGGLEHLNSTALGYPRFGFGPEPKERNEGVNSAGPGAPPPRTYRGFLSLVAHEFFHLWNVKRIRPDALGPFDYTKENYTKLLWVAEGITDYYARLVLRRAGLISEKDFLKENAKAFQELQNTPGSFGDERRRMRALIPGSSITGRMKTPSTRKSTITTKARFLVCCSIWRFASRAKEQVSRRRNALSLREFYKKDSQLHARRFSESLRVDGRLESGTIFRQVCSRSRRT